MARAVRYEPYGRTRDEWGPEQDPEDAEFGATSELYGGKERRRDTFGLAGTIHELEAYDYGARLYLPELGRWGSADSVTPDLVWEANGFACVRNRRLGAVGRRPEGAPEGRRAGRTPATTLCGGWMETVG